MVPAIEPYLDLYASASLEARATCPPATLSYGSHEDETLDLWPPPTAGGPLLAFVHGGYWRALSKDDGSFPAPALLDAGAGYASINYSLAPGATLDTITAQVIRALAFLVARGPQLGFDAERVHAAGHSAGGQLVAMALRHVPLAGLVLLAAVLDLEPLRRTSVNEPLQLTDDQTVRLSPLASVPSGAVPLTIAFGEHDTDEFKRQSLVYAAAWAQVSSGPAPIVVQAAGRNHFDLLFDLEDASRPLGAAVLVQLGVHR
jgi:arylformamidase